MKLGSTFFPIFLGHARKRRRKTKILPMDATPAEIRRAERKTKGKPRV